MTAGVQVYAMKNKTPVDDGRQGFLLFQDLPVSLLRVCIDRVEKKVSGSSICGNILAVLVESL